MKMKTKEQVIKEFNQSLEDSPTVTEIVFKRLMLEKFADAVEILADLRDIAKERK